MYRVIRARGQGKTIELMHLAEENNAIVVCHHPKLMEQKAEAEGFDPICFISFENYLSHSYDWKHEKILIDEIDGLAAALPGTVIGYSLSPED